MIGSIVALQHEAPRITGDLDGVLPAVVGGLSLGKGNQRAASKPGNNRR
jgi:hypothetical protein